MQIKNQRFDSGSASLFVANVFVELLRTKNVHEASVLRSGSYNATDVARSRIWMSHQFFEQRARPRPAISPDNVDQVLRFRVAKIEGS